MAVRFLIRIFEKAKCIWHLSLRLDFHLFYCESKMFFIRNKQLQPEISQLKTLEANGTKNMKVSFFKYICLSVGSFANLSME